MKKTYHLLRIAAKLENKYAQSQSLQQIIESAASYGQQSANGIMDFLTQLRQDKTSLSIEVTVGSGFLGGLSVKVGEPQVNPPQFASKYAALPKQIQNYLNKHISNFPQVPQGTTTLSWPAAGEEVASQ